MWLNSYSRQRWDCSISLVSIQYVWLNSFDELIILEGEEPIDANGTSKPKDYLLSMNIYLLGAKLLDEICIYSDGFLTEKSGLRIS